MSPAPGRLWSRYVAIGDSFTEGVSDPDPGAEDTYVGRADRLATSPGRPRRVGRATSAMPTSRSAADCSPTSRNASSPRRSTSSPIS